MKNTRMKKNITIIAVILLVMAISITTALGMRSVPDVNANEYGQTYGTLVDMKHLGEIPDLIRATGIDGTIGYVYKDELYPPLGNTPEEALRLQAERDARGEYSILLYESDGKTVIGEFPMGGGDRIYSVTSDISLD